MDATAALKLALPLFAWLVSYGLQQDHFTDKANACIATVTLFLAAAASVFLQGKLTGNIYSDTLLIVSTAIALQAETFLPLQKWLRGNFPQSPIKMMFRKKISYTTEKLPEQKQPILDHQSL